MAIPIQLLQTPRQHTLFGVCRRAWFIDFNRMVHTMSIRIPDGLILDNAGISVPISWEDPPLLHCR